MPTKRKLYTLICSECGEPVLYSFTPVETTVPVQCGTCILTVIFLAEHFEIKSVPSYNDYNHVSYTEMGKHYINGHHEKAREWYRIIRKYCGLQ